MCLLLISATQSLVPSVLTEFSFRQQQMALKFVYSKTLRFSSASSADQPPSQPQFCTFLPFFATHTPFYLVFLFILIVTRRKCPKIPASYKVSNVKERISKCFLLCPNIHHIQMSMVSKMSKCP